MDRNKPDANSQDAVQYNPPPNEINATLLIVDESHHDASDIWQRSIEQMESGKLIGLTAKPLR